jgi:hypothetical protein
MGSDPEELFGGWGFERVYQELEESRVWKVFTLIFSITPISRNLDGVNLNRNFPYSFNSTPTGSSEELCAMTYQGEKAGSEEETQAVISSYGNGEKIGLSFVGFENAAYLPANSYGKAFTKEVLGSNSEFYYDFEKHIPKDSL